MICLCGGFIHPVHRTTRPRPVAAEQNVAMTTRGLVEVPELPELYRKRFEKAPCPKCRSFPADRSLGAFVTVSWVGEGVVHQHALVPSGTLYRLSMETAIEAGRRLSGDYQKRVTIRSRRRAQSKKRRSSGPCRGMNSGG
jgi:hypothetical protein